jgi:hypothetical protein
MRFRRSNCLATKTTHESAGQHDCQPPSDCRDRVFDLALGPGRRRLGVLEEWVDEAFRAAGRLRRNPQIGQGFAFVLGLLGLFGNPILVFIAIFVYIAATAEVTLSSRPGGRSTFVCCRRE